MSYVFAIDASLTGLAVATGIDGVAHGAEEYASKAPKVPTVRARLQRYQLQADRVTAAINAHGADCGIDWHVFIEGYAFSRATAGVYLGELGHMLRLKLTAHPQVVSITEVTPGQIKQFAAGKGNAGKTAVATALTKRYGVEFDSDNKADAFALLQLGMCVVGDVEPPTQLHGKVTAKVREAWLQARELA